MNKCAWRVGREKAEKYGLDGDCEHCRYEIDVGIYQVCIAPAELSNGKVVATDCVVVTLHEPWPEEKGCMWCKHHYKPKTMRCQECVSAPGFPRFTRGESL